MSSSRLTPAGPITGIRSVLGGIALSIGGSFVLAITSPWHELLYVDGGFVTSPFPYYAADPGPGFAAVITVVIFLVGYSWIVLIQDILSAPHETGLQATLLVVAGMCIAVAELAGQLGLFPLVRFNHAVYGSLPFVLLVTLALFRLSLFDIEQVARHTVLETMRDPVIVLDGLDRIVDSNRTAAALWPALDGVACRRPRGAGHCSRRSARSGWVGHSGPLARAGR
ncbi:MAG: histidine kinase N-terminal 7TM domain-containing protein [Natrialbaceae archaeon]|nr:histidine kinase N-terminal 7TM domain-containing protein [Natrialbaceae archaeon]